MNIERHPLLDKYDFTRLENMWLGLIMDVIQELIEKEEMCDCQDCVLDVAALTLNRIPPNYWVSGSYNAFNPPENFRTDPKNLKKARDVVLDSVKQVKKNPHHLD